MEHTIVTVDVIWYPVDVVIRGLCVPDRLRLIWI